MTVTFAMLISSCNKEGAKPEIDIHELGFENSKTAVIGEELHMDAEIVADNKIDRIEIEIHPEGVHEKSTGGVNSSVEWEFDTAYTKFSGLRNTLFHEHIEIPGDADPGNYHFHLTVTDMEGYQTVFEDELELLVAAGSKGYQTIHEDELELLVASGSK